VRLLGGWARVPALKTINGGRVRTGLERLLQVDQLGNICEHVERSKFYIEQFHFLKKRDA